MRSGIRSNVPITFNLVGKRKLPRLHLFARGLLAEQTGQFNVRYESSIFPVALTQAFLFVLSLFKSLPLTFDSHFRAIEGIDKNLGPDTKPAKLTCGGRGGGRGVPARNRKPREADDRFLKGIGKLHFGFFLCGLLAALICQGAGYE